MSNELDHAAVVDGDPTDPMDMTDMTDLGAPAPFESMDDDVEVRRDGPLALVVGLGAAAVAVAYLQRAVGGGSTLDWLVCVVMAVLAGLHLLTALDARAPLMVIDTRGIRVRRGRTWQGVAWPEVERVRHTPRETMLRDGRISVVDSTGRELAVRLSLSTRLIGANWHELTDAVIDLSGGDVEVEEAGARVATHTPLAANDLIEMTEFDEIDEIEEAPEPGRDAAPARRSEVVRDLVTAPAAAAPVTSAEAVAAGASFDAGETATIVIGDVAEVLEHDPVVEPVIGPQVREARQRIGLTVDQLAERTRIRPHVIDAIETDDFVPCGGDFYARGHLRTLARVLGIDAEPLVETYDATYANAPIDPRTVFEAELASGSGSIRATRGGLNWSVLVATVMALVLAWSIARLMMDGPVPLADRPVLNGSPGKAALSGAETKTPKVPVTFTAATGGAEVVVRDGSGNVVFDHSLAFMQTAEVDAVPPVRISSSDGGLTVTVDGVAKGALGKTGQEAQNTFVVRD